MKIAASISALILFTLAPAAFAQAAPAPAVAATAGHYSVEDTDIGTLLDDPASKAILEKIVPEMAKSAQIDMARSLTLKSVQQYSPDSLSDAKLAEVQAELNKLPVKK